MKNVKTYICSLIIILSLANSFNMISMKQALASGVVKLNGKSSGIVLMPDGGRLFDLENLNPGDVVTRTLKIRNASSESFYLFMRAERTGERLDGPDLLKQLKLIVTYEGKIIYQGSATGDGGEYANMTRNIFIGKFNPKDSRELVVQIELPGPKTGNEFQNKTCEVKWIFTAQIDRYSNDKSIGRSDKDNMSIRQHLIDIKEELIPKGEPKLLLAEPEIPKMETSDTKVYVEEVFIDILYIPKTGENSPYLYYIVGGLLLLFGIGLVIR